MIQWYMKYWFYVYLIFLIKLEFGNMLFFKETGEKQR